MQFDPYHRTTGHWSRKALLGNHAGPPDDECALEWLPLENHKASYRSIGVSESTLDRGEPQTRVGSPSISAGCICRT
jgi:hypothetical protein